MYVSEKKSNCCATHGIKCFSIAWVGSISYGMMFLLGPVGTTLCKKIGCRMTTVIGCSTASLASLLGSFAPNIYVMDLTYGLMFGIGASLCYFPTVIILGTYFNKKLSLANGLTSSGSGVGSLAMGPIMQYLLNQFGMRNTMRISSAMLASILFVSFIYKPINTPFLNADKYTAKRNEAEKKKGCMRFIDLSLFKNKAYIMWFTSLSFWMLGYFVPFVHLVGREELVVEEQSIFVIQTNCLQCLIHKHISYFSFK